MEKSGWSKYLKKDYILLRGKIYMGHDAFSLYLAGKRDVKKPFPSIENNYVMKVTSLSRVFYATGCKGAKAAIHTWLLIGRRFGVTRDIRRLIAQLLWKARAAYCPCDP